MNEHELPNDIKELDLLYSSPEEEIEYLRKLVFKKSSRIMQLILEKDVLQNAYDKLLAHTQDLTDNINY